jgi:NADPH:quinone reductase-like Zn-dependent oxidoreductase
MRVLTVDAADRQSRHAEEGGAAVQVVGGRTLQFELSVVPDIAFDSEADYNREHALLRVRAFSLNYRDTALAMGHHPPGTHDRTRGFGSDFVADVVAIGRHVEGLEVGDRVIPSMNWPPEPENQVSAGVVTNHASRELQRVHASCLVRVPLTMSTTVAACFSVGAQTAYGMLRRAQVMSSSTILVTAATAATSLFAIGAAHGRGARVYALSGRDRPEEVTARLGADRCFDAGSAEQLQELSALARDLRGFDAVLDPFCDSYLLTAVKLLGFGGHYVTCRLAGGAGQELRGRSESSDPWLRMMMSAVAKNVTIHGQCLGTRTDLEDAILDWQAGRLDVVIDSCHAGREISTFIQRTFSPNRIGKVAYLFDENTFEVNG